MIISNKFHIFVCHAQLQFDKDLFNQLIASKLERESREILINYLNARYQVFIIQWLPIKIDIINKLLIFLFLTDKNLVSY